MKEEVKNQQTALNTVWSCGLLFALPSAFIIHPSSLFLPPAPQPAPPSVAASRGHGEVPPVEHRILRASPDRAARKRSTAARADSSRCLSPAWRQSNRSPCDSIHPKAWYPRGPSFSKCSKGTHAPHFAPAKCKALHRCISLVHR